MILDIFMKSPFYRFKPIWQLAVDSWLERFMRVSLSAFFQFLKLTIWSWNRCVGNSDGQERMHR